MIFANCTYAYSPFASDDLFFLVNPLLSTLALKLKKIQTDKQTNKHKERKTTQKVSTFVEQ